MTTTVGGEVVNDDPVLIDLNFGGDNFQIGVSTTTFKAGTLNFKVSNLGDTPHEFGIARGNSYEELPQLAVIPLPVLPTPPPIPGGYAGTIILQMFVTLI